MISTVLESIADALAKGESVAIAGFGTFAVKARGARQGRNPHTRESIEIAVSSVPSFKAGKTLRDAVAQSADHELIGTSRPTRRSPG